jgi:hypothetical protein
MCLVGILLEMNHSRGFAGRERKGRQMTKSFADKLGALVDEASREAPKPVYAALHMLYGCYLEGKQSEFAKHCCQFSPLALKRTDVIEGSLEKPPVIN